VTGPLLWLLYLLTYVDTERVLLGSRRRFDVNMGFSHEFLWKICTFLMVMEQKKLIEISKYSLRTGDWTNFWKCCKKRNWRKRRNSSKV